MFYESVSDFFYDPKSKLYYGNKQAAYYRYNSELKVFETVEGCSQASSHDPEPVLNGTGTSGTAGETAVAKKSISINIKTKSLKKGDKANNKEKLATLGDDEPMRKQHAMDMEKWSSRSREGKVSSEPSTPLQAPGSASRGGAVATATKAAEVTGVSAADVPRTAKGEPICLLCRRKFPTVEKLRYHVEVSQLHKDNLGKQQEQQLKEVPGEQPIAQTQDDKPAEYVDRAQQRRNLYGSDAGANLTAVTASVAPHTIPQILTDVASNSSVALSLHHPSVPPPCPHDPLGASSVGHKMLQKLGWTGGALSGRADRSEADELRQAQLQANLRREWDRSATAGQGSHRSAFNP
jgi:RNA-binding protein 5/10